MDMLSLNYTKTTRIRSGFITSVFWCSIFCFVVSTPSYIFLVFTLLVFDDLRFFFLICFFATSLLSLSVVFSSSEVTKTRDTEKKPIAFALALALSRSFSERKSVARKEVRERDGISIVVGVVIALSLLLRRIDVVASCAEKGRWCCARRTTRRRRRRRRKHRATATTNRTSPAALPAKTSLLRHSIAKRITRDFFGQCDVVVVVVVVVRFR